MCEKRAKIELRKSDFSIATNKHSHTHCVETRYDYYHNAFISSQEHIMLVINFSQVGHQRQHLQHRNTHKLFVCVFFSFFLSNKLFIIISSTTQSTQQQRKNLNCQLVLLCMWIYRITTTTNSTLYYYHHHRINGDIIIALWTI